MASWKPFYKYKTSQYTQRMNAQRRDRLQDTKKHKQPKKGRVKNDH